jgi:hypothetical protein
MAKAEKKEDPIDKIKEREELVQEALVTFRTTMMEIVQEYGLSGNEVFFIVSQLLSGLSSSTVNAEHNEYFGPEA